MQDSNILSLEQVSKYFYTSSGFFNHGKHFAALDNVSLSVVSGSSLGIVGESGSGKTTIARLMCSIYKADKGKVLYCGKDISALSKADRQEYTKNVQMVFQDTNNTLNPKLTIKSALSDGIKQRISIARAISINPKVIIADEPVSSLDVSVQAQILNLMKALQKNGITLILISHSLAVVSNLCENIAVMQKGKLEEYGNTLEVLSNPQSEYTKSLLASSSYTVMKNN